MRVPIYSMLKEQREVIAKQSEVMESQTQYMIDLAEELKGWDSLNAQAEEKDVSWQDYQENHKQCWEAYVENPIAKGYIDRLTDFVVKDGFRLVAEDQADGDNSEQDILDELIDADDLLDLATQACRELGIYGEVFYRWFGDDGVLIDPLTVEDIRTNPENVTDVKGFSLSYSVNGIPKTKFVPVGEIEHVKTNTVSTAKRGISDLLCVLKWLKRHKLVATNLVKRTNVALSVVIEKIIKAPGVSTTTAGGWKDSGDDITSNITGKRKERLWKPGTVLIHTPQVEYKVTPLPADTKGIVDLLKALSKIICSGLGLAEHWLGDTSESNLATATSLELPVLAKFERRQKEIARLLAKIVDKKLALAGQDIAYTIKAPELSPADEVAFANSLKAITEGLVAACDADLISTETASKTIGDSLDQYISYAAEIEKIEAEREAADERRQATGLPEPGLPATGMPEEPMNPMVAQQFAMAIREAEFAFQREQMDTIIGDYRDLLAKSFAAAKKKVLAATKQHAEEKSTQQVNA